MKNKFYITTSIAYTNAPPHIGFALELVQADVIARYRRILGDDVFFLTGTDEHGAKIVRAAKDAEKTPKQFTDEISKKYQALTKLLNLSNNDFIRTTDQKRHWPNVQKFWLKLKENGDIYKKKYRGLYCVGCEAFFKEKDLVDGKCPIHQQKPEIVEEENWFFRLSKYAGNVKDKIKNGEIRIIPDGRKNEILSFIEQGVEDVSCSRSKENLQWGIPVPGDNTQIIYIWFEALINYLLPKKYWPADVHCVGKDIFRFHALLWPAMLLSFGLDLPKTIFVHGYITSGGQKMSKSLGNVVDPFGLVKKYGADAVRYFLLREIPSTEDGDFTEEKFKERYNADLANGIGNTVSRILTMVEKYYNGVVPKREENQYPDIEVLEEDYIWDFVGGQKMFKDDLEGPYYFNVYLSDIISVFRGIDKRIEETKFWEVHDDSNFNSYVLKDILYTWLESLRILAYLLSPIIPETSDKIFEQLGLNSKKEKKKKFDEAIKFGGLKPGNKIKKSEPLFPRV